MLVSLWSIGAVAENFMVGDVKYDVRTDSTVTLKDGKKATGDFVVPSKVVNPKTGKEYTVNAIASSAFKKSMITSIEIPSTVKTLGSLATCTMPSAGQREVAGINNRNSVDLF